MTRKKPIPFSREQLDKLVKEGKIRGYDWGKEAKKKNPKESKQNTGQIIVKFFPTKSKEKNSIQYNLIEWCQFRCLPLYGEYFFHPTRIWRFDWCIPALKIAIEYNGIMGEKSRHITIDGYSGDMNKINAAQALGWTVLQFTPLNYTTLIDQLNTIENAKKKEGEK